MARDISSPDPSSQPVGKSVAGAAHGIGQQPMYLSQILTIAPWQREGLDDAGGAPVESLASFGGRFGLFLGVVVLPLFLAVLYFGLIAAGLYVTETKFIVRSSASGNELNLSSVLNNSGMSRAVDETYAVSTYIASRDMAKRLEAEKDLRGILSRKEGDFVFRFPNIYSRDNAEQLYKAYRRFIEVEVDSSTGITTLRTLAFRPEDAKNMSVAIVEFADAFINKLNERAHSDAIRYSLSLLDESSRRLSEAEQKLAAFRNKELLVDPEKETGASMEILARLATEIARQEAAVAQLAALTPDNPSLLSAREKIKSLRFEYDKQRVNIAGATNSIASKLEGFERIALERELAAKALAFAQLEVEKARQSAHAQRVYLQTIVAGNQSDSPALPWRMVSILVVLGVGMLLFWIIKFLVDITLEHKA